MSSCIVLYQACEIAYYGHTIRKHGERDNARNNASGIQARKTTYGVDGRHQDVNFDVAALPWQKCVTSFEHFGRCFLW